MKKFLMVFVVSLFIANQSIARSNEEICSEISNIAGIVMKYRQKGVEFPSMFAAASKNDAINGGSLEQNLVRLAFTYPYVPDYSAKESIIANFSNRVYSDCLKVRNKSSTTY